jgi:hypothetical protein
MSVLFSKEQRVEIRLHRQSPAIQRGMVKTKQQAKQAEAQRMETVVRERSNPATQTDMAFIELANRRLDHVKAYCSDRHYNDYRYLARRWIERWGAMSCGEIVLETVELFILDRSRVSPHTASSEIRYLRATFNFGKKKRWITKDPKEGLAFLPVEKKIKYIPPQEDIEKVIAAADDDTQDYLWAIRDPAAG